MTELQPKTIVRDRVTVFINSTRALPKPSGIPVFALETLDMAKVIDASVRPKNETDPSVSLGSVVYEVTCSPNCLNPMGSMHGGCVATIHDNLSTYALCILDTYWDDFDPSKQSLESYIPKFLAKIIPDMGVSRQLQVIYHRPILPGQKVFLKVDIISNTNRFTTYTARMYDDQGRVCSILTHDRVKLPSKL